MFRMETRPSETQVEVVDCAQCGKVADTVDHEVPANWIAVYAHGSEPGLSEQHAFCSKDCLARFTAKDAENTHYTNIARDAFKEMTTT